MIDGRRTGRPSPWWPRPAGLLVGILLLLAGCGGSGATTPPTPDAANDRLAQILSRGTIILSTDLEYPPQSYAVEGAERKADTRCAPNQLTAPEVGGFDVDTAVAVAAELGVEPCFITPSWTEIIGGGWGDRWDIAFGSVSITTERMKVLHFTQPYYADAAYFYVHEDSAIADPTELGGLRVGACASCVHEAYLEGTLVLPGQEIEPVVSDAEIVLFDVEAPGFEALAAGDGVELSAFLAQEPVGSSAIADGMPIKPIGEPAFFAYAAGAIDRSASADVTSLIDRVNEIVASLHADGTLRESSMTHYGRDYTAEAAEFDVATLEQAP